MRYLNFVAASGLFFGLAVGAQAQFVSPTGLLSSPDGVGTDIQTLVSKTGSLSTVGSGSNYGDQDSGRVFELADPSKTTTWSVLWQKAGFAPKHKLGYYTDLTSANPTITWVIGGDNSGLPKSGSVSISGKFGLAFSSGDNNKPSSVYYSETWRNPNYQNRAVVLRDRDNTGVKPSGLFVSWEDLPDLGDKDYNDFGLYLGNTRSYAPVPEPGTMAILGIGAAAFLRRRRKSA